MSNIDLKEVHSIKDNLETVDTVLELHRNKKLGWFLKLRIIILIILFLFFAFTVAFDILGYHSNPWPVLWFFPAGVMAGYLWFHRMTAVHFDEDSGLMKIRRFDFVAVFFIALYFISRAVLSHIFKAEFSNIIGVSVATYSIVSGIMIGRLLGVFRVIHDLHTKHSEKTVIEK